MTGRRFGRCRIGRGGRRADGPFEWLKNVFAWKVRKLLFVNGKNSSQKRLAAAVTLHNKSFHFPT